MPERRRRSDLGVDHRLDGLRNAVLHRVVHALPSVRGMVAFSACTDRDPVGNAGAKPHTGAEDPHIRSVDRRPAPTRDSQSRRLWSARPCRRDRPPPVGNVQCAAWPICGASRARSPVIIPDTDGASSSGLPDTFGTRQALASSAHQGKLPAPTGIPCANSTELDNGINTPAEPSPSGDAVDRQTGGALEREALDVHRCERGALRGLAQVRSRLAPWPRFVASCSSRRVVAAPRGGVDGRIARRVHRRSTPAVDRAGAAELATEYRGP